MIRAHATDRDWTEEEAERAEMRDRARPSRFRVEMERTFAHAYLADLGAAWEGSSATPAAELVPSIVEILVSEGEVMS